MAILDNMMLYLSDCLPEIDVRFQGVTEYYQYSVNSKSVSHTDNIYSHFCMPIMTACFPVALAPFWPLSGLSWM
jgi:hypothetical protein